MEGEAYDRAFSVVVEAQAVLPVVAFWDSWGGSPTLVGNSGGASVILNKTSRADGAMSDCGDRAERGRVDRCRCQMSFPH